MTPRSIARFVLVSSLALGAVPLGVVSSASAQAEKGGHATAPIPRRDVHEDVCDRREDRRDRREGVRDRREDRRDRHDVPSSRR